MNNFLNSLIASLLVVWSFNALAIDSDSDGIDDSLDNCPNITNTLQLDVDSNLIGDACDAGTLVVPITFDGGPTITNFFEDFPGEGELASRLPIVTNSISTELGSKDYLTVNFLPSEPILILPLAGETLYLRLSVNMGAGPVNGTVTWPSTHQLLNVSGEMPTLVNSSIGGRLNGNQIGGEAVYAVTAPFSFEGYQGIATGPFSGSLKTYESYSTYVITTQFPAVSERQLMFQANELAGSQLIGSDLSNINFSNISLIDASLTDANLTGANLTGVNLTGANLTNANLTDANLTDANLTDANLTDANLTGVNLADVNLTGVNLTDANLTGVSLTSVSLTGVNLTGVNLTGVNLTDANLTGVNLTGANLTNANLTNAYLKDANLSNADLTDATLAGVYKQLANASGITLPAGYFIINNYIVGPNVNLSNTDLSNSDMSGINLSGVDLSGADLSGTDLTGATLTDVSGQLANASGITLPAGYFIINNYIIGSDVRLINADLSNTDLSDINLSGVDLSGANLSNVILSGANLSGTNLTGATLTGVSGILSDSSGIILPQFFALEGGSIKADADSDGLSDELEIATAGDATSTTIETLIAAVLATDNSKNVPAMGGIGLLALGLSMLGLGAVRMRKK